MHGLDSDVLSISSHHFLVGLSAVLVNIVGVQASERINVFLSGIHNCGLFDSKSSDRSVPRDLYILEFELAAAQVVDQPDDVLALFLREVFCLVHHS